MKANQAISIYQSVSKESEIQETDPYNIICILMKNALESLTAAKIAINHNQIEQKGKNISLAISLIDGLKASLDMKQGSEISENLSALYDYMMFKLLEANLNNDIKVIDEIQGLLLEIYQAWEKINPQKSKTDVA